MVARDGKAKSVTNMRADAIFYNRPHTQALSELLSTRQLGFNFWIEPIPAFHRKVTLLGASGMERGRTLTASAHGWAIEEAEHAVAAVWIGGFQGRVEMREHCGTRSLSCHEACQRY